MFGWKVWCLALVSCMVLGAQTRELHGPRDFCGCDIECVPDGWELDDCRFYQPEPTMLLVPGEDNRHVLWVKDIYGSHGFNLCLSRKFRAKVGDVVTGSAWVSGRGVGWFAVQSYRGDQCLSILSRKKIALTDTWQKVCFTLPVKELPALQGTDHGMFMLGADHGSELCLMSLCVSLTENRETAERADEGCSCQAAATLSPSGCVPCNLLAKGPEQKRTEE